MSGDKTGGEVPDETTFTLMGQEYMGRRVAGLDMARPGSERTVVYNYTMAPLGPEAREAAERAVLRALETPRGRRSGLIPVDKSTLPIFPTEALPMPDDRPPPANRARYAARRANVEAHGPAWSEGTPHTDEAAAVMLAQVETRAMVRERARARSARAQGEVIVEPSPVVTVGEPIPRATLTLAEWREAWRAAEVPVLCTLRERCEASGARPIVAECVAHESLRARIPQRRRISAAWLAGTANRGYGDALEEVLCVGVEGDSAEHVPADAERVTDLAVLWRGAWRAAPSLSDARGWCPALAGYAASSTPVDPATAAATWQAMCAACPERVYPEPGE